MKALNEILVDYLPLIKHIAKDSSRFDDSGTLYHDFISVGSIGLLSYLHKNETVENAAVAGRVVYNSIIDYIRKNDTMPHRLRRFKSKYSKAVRTLNREPTNTELSEIIGVDETEIARFKQKLREFESISLSDEYLGSSDDPLENCIKSELLRKIKKAFDSLSDNRKQVLNMHYGYGLSLKEIADKNNISPVRIGQIKSSAISQLKNFLISNNNRQLN